MYVSVSYTDTYVPCVAGHVLTIFCSSWYSKWILNLVVSDLWILPQRSFIIFTASWFRAIMWEQTSCVFLRRSMTTIEDVQQAAELFGTSYAAQALKPLAMQPVDSSPVKTPRPGSAQNTPRKSQNASDTARDHHSIQSNWKPVLASATDSPDSNPSKPLEVCLNLLAFMEKSRDPEMFGGLSISSRTYKTLV